MDNEDVQIRTRTPAFLPSISNDFLSGLRLCVGSDLGRISRQHHGEVQSPTSSPDPEGPPFHPGTGPIYRYLTPKGPRISTPGRVSVLPQDRVSVLPQHRAAKKTNARTEPEDA